MKAYKNGLRADVLAALGVNLRALHDPEQVKHLDAGIRTVAMKSLRAMRQRRDHVFAFDCMEMEQISDFYEHHMGQPRQHETIQRSLRNARDILIERVPRYAAAFEPIQE